MVNKSHFRSVSPQHVVLKSFTIHVHYKKGDADESCARHKRKQTQKDAFWVANKMVNTM